jgi:hypothetical protein
VNDEDVNDEEVNDEEVNDEVVSNEEVNDEEVNDEEVNDEEVNDEEVNDEEVNDEEVNDEQVDVDVEIMLSDDATDEEVILNAIEILVSESSSDKVMEECLRRMMMITATCELMSNTGAEAPLKKLKEHTGLIGERAKNLLSKWQIEVEESSIINGAVAPVLESEQSMQSLDGVMNPQAESSRMFENVENEKETGVECEVCFKMLHVKSIKRHMKTQHKASKRKADDQTGKENVIKRFRS